MPLFIVTLHIKDAQGVRPFIEIEAESLEDAEAKFITSHRKDDQYRIPLGDALYFVDRSAVAYYQVNPVPPSTPSTPNPTNLMEVYGVTEPGKRKY